MTEETNTGRDDLNVLAPKTVEWEIGGNSYEQRPLPISRLADVLDFVVERLLQGGDAAVLDELLQVTRSRGTTDSEGVEEAEEEKERATEEMIPVMLKLLVQVPRTIPEIVARILDAPVESMQEHLMARQGIAILRTFVEQNEIAELVQDFFGLTKSLGITAETGTAEETPEEPPNEEESAQI